MTSTQDNRSAARQELRRRELARRHLLEFIQFTHDDYEANWHHRVVCETVEGWIDGTGPSRVMVFMPPAHGKSQIVSRSAPAYILGRIPDARVIAVSHTQRLANEMSEDVQAILRSDLCQLLFGELVPRQRLSVESWRTLKGGQYLCAGMGGPIAGKHFDFGIIDDPVKNAEEAYSFTYREKYWQWYTSVFRTRRLSGARMLLTTTRWHEDDLAGRILDKEKGKWSVVRFPGIAEQNEAHRKQGEALWPQRYPLSDLIEQRGIAPHSFDALYQQRPVAAGGDHFKREWFQYAERNGSPDLYRIGDEWRNVNTAMRYLTVDLAASTKDSGDYTVIGAWASWPDGHLLLTDVVRKRLEGPDIIPEITLSLNRNRCGTVWIERIGFQTALIQMAARAGLPVRALTPDKDKITRAGPAASVMANGKLWFATGEPWLIPLENELVAFPKGTHDDQADVVAYGVRVHLDRVGWKVERTALY